MRIGDNNIKVLMAHIRSMNRFMVGNLWLYDTYFQILSKAEISIYLANPAVTNRGDEWFGS